MNGEIKKLREKRENQNYFNEVSSAVPAIVLSLQLVYTKIFDPKPHIEGTFVIAILVFILLYIRERVSYQKELMENEKYDGLVNHMNLTNDMNHAYFGRILMHFNDPIASEIEKAFKTKELNKNMGKWDEALKEEENGDV